MILERAICFVWVVATFGGLVLFLGTIWKLLSSDPLPGGFRLPAIALELVRDEEHLKDLLRRYSPEKARKALKLDRFFILIYVLLFAALGYSLVRTGALSYVPFLGAAVFLCIAGAALFDLLENRRTGAVLRAQNRTTVERLRRPACTKWSLLFALMALLAIPFAWQGGWLLVVAALYLAAAGVGALGLVWRNPLVEWAFALMGLALVPTGEAVFAIAGTLPT